MTKEEKPRVFVIDDSDIARQVVAMILDAYDFTVETANTPFGLEQRLGTFQPHAILLDLNMPGVTHADLPAIVKTLRAASNGLVLFHSGSSANVLHELVRTCGADGYVEKSEDDARFSDEVRRFTSRVLR